jgi:tetratricopeptide (TPR) repeat protein
LWQYNLVPFQINAQINKADILAQNKNCSGAVALMENVLKSRSILDAYARMEYVEITKTCAEFYPDNKLSYIKRDYEVLQEAVKIQPLYTRYWIGLGQFATVLKDYKQANDYFNTALSLSPGHQEILADKLDADIALGNYKELVSVYKYLIEKNPGNFQYHASLAFAYKLTGDYANARKEAMIVLQLSPESKPNIEEFLETLP